MSTPSNDSSELAQHLRAVAQVMAVVELQLDGTVIAANERFCAALGVRRDEVERRAHRGFVDPGFAASAAYAELWARLRAGEAQQVEAPSSAPLTRSASATSRARSASAWSTAVTLAHSTP